MDGIYQCLLEMLAPQAILLLACITGRLSLIYWLIFLTLFLVWLRWDGAILGQRVSSALMA